MKFESWYRHEHDYITQLMRQLAADKPDLSAVSPDAGDPNIARLIEGFSALTARLQQKITDDFPEITQPLLERVWSFPLQPIPATSVVQFAPINKQIDHQITLPGGSTLLAPQNSHDPDICDDPVHFQTCSDLIIEPVRLNARKLHQSPDQTDITLTFQYTGKEAQWRGGKVRLFLSESAPLSALLILWLDQYLTDTTLCYGAESFSADIGIDTGEHGRTADQLIIPAQRDAFWPLQGLTESFCLPHIASFITLDLSTALARHPLTVNADNATASATFEVVLSFQGQMPLTDRELQQLFTPHCVAVINLDADCHEIIRCQPGKNSYTLNAPSVFHIQQIYAVQEPDQKTGHIRSFHPWHSAYLRGRFSETGCDYFYDGQRELSVLDNPLFTLRFYTHDRQVVTDLPYDTIICDYTGCDSRASQVQRGEITDFTDTTQGELAAGNIVPASRMYPPVVAGHCHWSALSTLLLSPLFLNDVTNLKIVLRQLDFYAAMDLPLSQTLQRYCDGLMALTTTPIDWLVKGVPCRAVNIVLTLDETCYGSQGEMYLFARRLNRLFPLWYTDSSLLIMTVVNHTTNERWSMETVSGHRKLL